MAQEVPQFTATSDLTPSDKGIQAEELAGRRIGAYGHQIQSDLHSIGDQIEQHQATMEVSALYKTGVDMENNFEQGWAQFTADPANKGRTDLADAYMKEHVEPLIEEWGSHAKTDRGREVALQMGERIRSGMFERTSADQSALDAETAHENLTGTVNGLARGAAIDPSSMEAKLGAANTAVEAIASTIPNVERRTAFQEEMGAQARHDIVVSAYTGMAEAAKQQVAQTGDPTKSPALAAMRQAFADGRGAEEVRGPEFQEFGKMADEAERAGQEQYKVGQAAADKSAELQYKGQATQLTTAISDAVASGQPITRDMLEARDKLVADPRAAALIGPEIDKVNALIRDAVKAQADRSYVVTNPHVSADLVGRLTLAAGDPRAISEAELVNDVANGQLSKDDYSMFHQALPRIAGDPKFKAAQETIDHWMEGYKAQITGGGAYPGGAAAFAQFKHDAQMNFMQWGASENDWGKAVEIMTNEQNPRNFGRMVDEYRRAAMTTNPLAALNRIPGYQQLSGAAPGSAVSPILGPTPAAAVAAGQAGVPGPLDAKTAGDMARIAGGH